MTRRQTLVLGGPGSGKTTRLLNVMEKALDRGVPPSRIAFNAFTNAASDEARVRACEKFKFSPDDLPFFRTLHSMCFRELGLQRSEVVQNSHLDLLSDLTGELITGELEFDAPAQGKGADPLLTVDHYARTTLQTLKGAWEDHGRELDWYRLKRFADAYHLFKQDHGLFDFTDMLERFIAEGRSLPVDVAILDEVQDFTLLQWAVARKAFADVPEIWAAGDDDQSIHKWAGAADDHFLNLDNFDREILPLSHRLPRSIFALAQEISARLGKRYAKQTRPSDREGKIEWVAQPSEVDLSSGTWLLLARTRYQLKGLIETARDQGVIYSMKGKSSVDPEHAMAIRSYEKLRKGLEPIDALDAANVLKALARPAREPLAEDRLYGSFDLGIDVGPIWHDALIGIPLEDREYYLICLRRGERLTGMPRVRIETIHGAKGAEAENVLLKTDLSYKTHKGYELDPDSEHRVFYVGVTRASENLFLVAPQTQYGYQL